MCLIAIGIDPANAQALRAYAVVGDAIPASLTGMPGDATLRTHLEPLNGPLYDGRAHMLRVEDIDHRIEAREHERVADIFARKGETYFRSVERSVLQELLPQRQIIIATGGGTCVDPESRADMLADGAVVWLDVPLERVIERVPADGRRPLASDRTQMEQLFARRQAAYAAAHLRVDASRPIAEIVERILEWIGF